MTRSFITFKKYEFLLTCIWVEIKERIIFIFLLNYHSHLILNNIQIFELLDIFFLMSRINKFKKLAHF